MGLFMRPAFRMRAGRRIVRFGAHTQIVRPVRTSGAVVSTRVTVSRVERLCVGADGRGLFHARAGQDQGPDCSALLCRHGTVQESRLVQSVHEKLKAVPKLATTREPE